MVEVLYTQKGKRKIINCDPNTNLIFPITKLHSIEYDIPVGTIEIASKAGKSESNPFGDQSILVIEKKIKI